MATCGNRLAWMPRAATQNSGEPMLTKSAQDIPTATVTIGRTGVRPVVADTQENRRKQSWLRSPWVCIRTCECKNAAQLLFSIAVCRWVLLLTAFVLMRFEDRAKASRCRRLAESNGCGRAEESSRNNWQPVTTKNVYLRHYLPSGGRDGRERCVGG